MTVRFLDRARAQLDAHLADVKAHDLAAARRWLHAIAEALVCLERQRGLRRARAAEMAPSPATQSQFGAALVMR